MSKSSSSDEYHSEGENDSNENKEEEKKTPAKYQGGGIFDGAEIIGLDLDKNIHKKNASAEKASAHSEAVVISSVGSDSKYKGSLNYDKSLSNFGNSQ